jgi:hypothetical protein
MTCLTFCTAFNSRRRTLSQLKVTKLLELQICLGWQDFLGPVEGPHLPILDNGASLVRYEIQAPSFYFLAELLCLLR